MSRTHGFLTKQPRTAIIFIVMVLVVATAAVAQTTTATIRGMVTDESGNIFSGAVVTATSLSSGYTHSATAGADGSYVLGGLTPGSYRIAVSGPSSTPRSRDVTLLVGQNLSIDFSLATDMMVSESVTVVGTAPQEMGATEVATNVTRQQIENLPQNDRNFLNFAALAPGMSLGTDEYRKEVKGGAQSASSTNVFIDGVSFKNDVLQGGVVGQDSSRGNPFPQNAVQEFRVITQNYSAEYQKASSAIITAVTKSGSNAFSGDAFFLYQDKDLVAENPLNGADPEYERNQWGISFGGPIIRDRMHFFGSFEANDQDREETVSLGGGFQNATALRSSLASYIGTFVSPFRSDLGFAKITYQPTSSQIVDWSANYRSETDIRGFGGQRSREAAEDVQNDVRGTTLRHQFTAMTWLNELSGSYQDFNWNPQPQDRELVGFEYEGLLRIGGADSEQNFGQERLAFRNDTTFTGFEFAGQHTLKVGVNAEFLEYTAQKFIAENPVFFFRSDTGSAIPYKARFGFGDPDLSSSNEQYGLYVQDEWSLGNNIELNLGLRWDYETNMIDTDYVTPADVRARLSDDFAANYFTDGNDRSAKTDMFQPRLGIAYDVFANNRTVLFAGAGRYYDRSLYNNTLDERFRLQHSVGEFFFSENGGIVNGQPTVQWDPRYLSREGLRALQATGRTGRPEVFLIENDTRVPYSDQFNFGVRQSLGPVLASLTYSNIRSKNGFSYLWGKGFCCPQVDPAYSNVLISSDDIKTWYDAVYLTLDMPYSAERRYGFGFAYTYADAEQVGGDLFSLDLPKISDWPRYGTPGSQDHRVVANGIVDIPWGSRLATVIQYSSGDKYRIHNFARGFCVGCYEPVTGEGPSWTTVDLRVDKDFRFARSYRAGFSLEAFNIFNEERYSNFQDFNPPEGNPNLGKPTAIVGGSQRRYQIGVRFGF